VNRLLARIFSRRRKAERLDLEAIEMAVRSALRQAGAAALSELLQFEPPPADQRSVPCPCGQQAPYHELRSKPFLTAVGPATISRPCYLCPHCHAPGPHAMSSDLWRKGWARRAGSQIFARPSRSLR
jgi:hypothetical protein